MSSPDFTKNLMRRVVRAQNAIHSTERYESGCDTIKDILLDIMLYSIQRGHSFESALENARRELPKCLESTVYADSVLM